MHTQKNNIENNDSNNAWKILHSRFLIGLIGVVLAPATLLAQDVQPLVQTRWGQNSPFNLLCPKDSVTGQYALAGCGPIAMAQIIRYYKQPSVSPSGDDYQWDLMTAQPSTLQEGLAIAKLVADCGVNAFTSYGEENSSTQTQNMVNALKKRFGYNPYIAIVRRELYPGEEGRKKWQKLIFDELRAGRPVIARGQKGKDGKSGHLFLLDGLQDTLVHVNFGWKGKSDGYYSLDDLGGYDTFQRVAIGIGKADYMPAIREIQTFRAGQLAELLPQQEWPELNHLKISGPMDESDFKLLQQMAREDTINGRSGFLRSLDLREAALEYLPDSAFKRTKSLVYIRLPKVLRQIGRGAFSGCWGLNEVEIPASVWRIRGGAFANCQNLLDIHIPEGVHNVLSSTFRNCRNLTEVMLPTSIDTLGANVFEGCQRLERLSIPAATKQIGVNTIRRCPNLREVIIDPANTEFAYRSGQIVGLTKHAQEQLGQLKRTAPTTLKAYPSTRVRKVKMVKRNGKWVELKPGNK